MSTLQREVIMYAVHRQDEDQAYIMDDAGNFQPGPASPEDETPDAWGDDQDFLESLNQFEQTSEEISDQLLLACVDDGPSLEERQTNR